jgi:alpha-galactosidase
MRMKALPYLFVLLCAVPSAARRAPLRAPFMGWTTWLQYQCAAPPRFNCSAADEICINERLIAGAAATLAAEGYLAAGWSRVVIDDCAVAHARDPATHALPLDPLRFPSGLAGLAAKVHASGLQLGAYTAISYETCTARWHFPGSRGFEAVDAANWAAAGVDFVKADGCGDVGYYATGYALLGEALDAQPQNVTFSCSWPYYVGGAEPSKNWTQFLAAGCTTGRSFFDAQCSWNGSVAATIDHYGDNAPFFQQLARETGFVVDADQLLAGTRGGYAPPNQADSTKLCLTPDEERAQFAIYCILALPLQISANLSTMPPYTKAMLTNAAAIAVSQDGVVGGLRVSPKGATEVYARNLSAGGQVAVVLFNKGEAPANITVAFADVGLPPQVKAFDVWAQTTTTLVGSLTEEVPPHGAAFARLAPAGGEGAGR